MTQLITRPKLAYTPPKVKPLDITKLRYPIYAMPKYDGIRALVIDGKLVSRTFKPIPNRWIREALETLYTLPDGMDGELICYDSNYKMLPYNEVESAVMTRDGIPKFKYHIFDYVTESIRTPYAERIGQLYRWYDDKTKSVGDSQVLLCVSVVPVTLCHDPSQLTRLEIQYLSEGYEGVILADPKGRYKCCGRSTLKEQFLLKLKRFEDSEAYIIGMEELQIHIGDATSDAFGLAERDSRKENLCGGGKMGVLICRDIYTGQEIRIGSGFDDKFRKDVYDNFYKYQAKFIKYKYQKHGTVDKPRCPVFVGMRNPIDL